LGRRCAIPPNRCVRRSADARFVNPEPQCKLLSRKTQSVWHGACHYFSERLTKNSMTTRTMRNLDAAMQAEALAYAKLARFAAAARLHDNETLAALFQEAADVDRCRHFACEAELAGLNGGEAENLCAAIDLIIRQIAMYDGFVRQAEADGDLQVARVLRRVRNDEITQLLAFRAARHMPAEPDCLIQTGDYRSQRTSQSSASPACSTDGLYFYR